MVVARCVEACLGAQPELYTIAWFLTLFAHVLPIEKTCVLWDLVLVRALSAPPLNATATERTATE